MVTTTVRSWRRTTFQAISRLDFRRCGNIPSTTRTSLAIRFPELTSDFWIDAQLPENRSQLIAYATPGNSSQNRAPQPDHSPRPLNSVPIRSPHPSKAKQSLDIPATPAKVGFPPQASLAQLDRASVYGTEGCWFEPSEMHLEPQELTSCGSFLLVGGVPIKKWVHLGGGCHLTGLPPAGPSIDRRTSASD